MIVERALYRPGIDAGKSRECHREAHQRDRARRRRPGYWPSPLRETALLRLRGSMAIVRLRALVLVAVVLSFPACNSSTSPATSTLPSTSLPTTSTVKPTEGLVTGVAQASAGLIPLKL